LNDGENDFSFDAVLGEGDDEGTWSLTLAISDLADGVYSIRVVATDLAGNEGSADASGTLTVKTAAGVTVNDVLTTETDVTLTGTIDDDVEVLEVTVNDVTYTWEAGEIDVEAGVWTLVLPTLEAGDYVVSVYAKDDMDNETTITGRLLIDETAPTVEADDDLPATIADGFVLTGTFVDDNIDTIVVTFDDGDGGVFTFNADIDKENGTWSVVISDPELQEVLYTVSVVATDEVGNTSGSVPLGTTTVDNTAPEIAITDTILVETATRPGFAGTIDDPTATVVVTINDVDYDAVNNGDGTWSLAEGVVTGLTPGTTYTVSVTATDAAGNSTTVTQDVTAGASRTVTLGGEFNKLTYVDANGVTVTVKAGKGEVIITFLTGDDYEAAVKGKAVTVTGTIVTVDVSIKDATSVAISTKAPKGSKNNVTDIGTITIEGSIKTLNAAKVNLTGGIAVVEGEGKTGVIQTIKLNNISGNITMSAFAKGVAITAASMQGVTLATDFIKTLKVTSMTNCTINAKVIATVTVPTMIGCTINAVDLLKTLTVKTKFENTNVTSDNLQKATLTNVITDNGESAFGLRAKTFKQVTVTVDGGKAKTKWDFKKFNDEDNNAIGDFFITTTIVS